MNKNISPHPGLMGFLHSRLNAFRHASAGWWYVLRTQRNAWIHAVISVVVFFVGLWLGLDPHEWAIIVLITVVVWMAEFINTAIEAIVDLASPGHHPLAKVGKDVGAAAVLIAAIAAAIIGLLILGPHLLEKIQIASGR